MSHRALSFKITFVLALLLSGPFARALTNGVALTPPMGFNSWYSYGAGVNEALIKSIADAMATNGLLAAGYNYINLDDGWAGYRDANGVMVADTNKFPSGMKALADYVHGKGFKIGLYTTAGTSTCAGYPASANHFAQDANTYAAWGIDYLKFEGCDVSTYEGLPRQQIYIARMGQALAHCGRPIVFSVSFDRVFENWMPQYINLWRGTGDIDGSWSTILSHIDFVAQTPGFVLPGGWNDLDVLEIGSGFFSEVEYTSIFSMWSMLACPLLTLTAGTTHTNILCNRDAIAVDQDPACIQGICVATNGNLQVWRKPLGSSNSSTIAVALFNRGADAAAITANWSDLGLSPDVATVWDIWAQAYAGNFTNSYTASIPGHGVQFLRLVNHATVPLPPVGTNYLSDLPWLADVTTAQMYATNYPYNQDQSGVFAPLTLHGVTYAKGLGEIVYTRLSYFLGGATARFHSDIGVDDAAGNRGAIIFRVYADGTKLYDSGVMTTQTPTQTIDLNLTGYKVLTLEATNGVAGNVNDYADWAGARITVLALPPPAPGGLSALPTAAQFTLTWHTTFGATDYYLKRATIPGGPYTTIVTVSAPGYGDTNLVLGATYYYVVSALNANGESANSAEIGVALPVYWTNTVTGATQNWNLNGNWTNTVSFPNRAGALAIINSGIQSNQTINLNQAITVGSLVLGAVNGAAAFTIAPNGGTLTFDNGPSPATLTELTASAGDTLAAPITLSHNLVITNNTTHLLTLSGIISGTGSLTQYGVGPLLLSGTNTFANTLAVMNGTLQIGNAAALGATNGGTIIASGATLDLNGFGVGTEPVSVSGAGFTGNGAIINSAALPQTNALQFVTLAGDTTWGGSARWDIRGATNGVVSGALSTGGNAFNLIKVGGNQISLADVSVDSALGNIDVQQGTLGLETVTTSLGNPANTLTVEPGATLSFLQTTHSWNKVFVLNGDGVTSTFSSGGGSNTVVGPMTLNGPSVFNIASGALALNGPINGPGSFTKTLSGTLYLGGTNGFTGNLWVNAGALAVKNSNALTGSSSFSVASSALLDVSAISPGLTLLPGQTLGGGGAIIGNLTVGSRATLSPANVFNVLTFSNALTLAPGSACVMEVNHAPLTNDQLQVGGTLTLAGTLVITNLGSSALAAGDNFKLFNAASYAGGFASITPAIPGAGMLWDASTLATNGTLHIIAGTLPHFTTFNTVGGSLVTHGTGGKTNAAYYLLTTTNLALPIPQWTRIATNHFDASGNFAFTNSLGQNAPDVFYLLQLP